MKVLRWITVLAFVLITGQLSQAQIDDNELHYYKAENHTVRLFKSIEGSNSQFGAICTAVLIEKMEGVSTLLTAGHCVDEDAFYFVLSDRPYPVIKKYVSKYSDLAIIFVAGSVEGKTPAAFTKRYLCVGDRLFNVAYPGLHTFKRTGEFRGEDWYAGKIDIVVIPGCSGSGIFDEDGNLAGIVVSYDKKQPVSYYIPVNEFSRFLHQLSVDGEITVVTADDNETGNQHIRSL